MKRAADALTTLMDTWEGRPSPPGFPDFNPRRNATFGELRRIAEKRDKDVVNIMNDHRIPKEGRLAEAAKASREAASKVEAIRKERMATLDEQLEGVIPEPRREPVHPGVFAAVATQLQDVDGTALEAYYRTAPVEHAAVIEQLGPRLVVEGGVPRSEPRLSEEAITARAYTEASPEQQARHDGLVQIKNKLRGACGMVLEALKDEGI